MHAAGQGRVDCMRLLLEHGAKLAKHVRRFAGAGPRHLCLLSSYYYLISAYNYNVFVMQIMRARNG